MIRLDGIRRTYHMGAVDVPALDGVSLEIEEGAFVAITGASGSGKSTLLHVLGLLDRPDGGSYELMGHEVSLLSDDEMAVLRGETIGFVFQLFNLLSRTTALENVALPLLYTHREDGSADRASRLLEEMGLGGRAGHRPSELSGGEQQRVAIARALVNEPRILLADEPTGNLDSRTQVEIMNILKALNRKGITVILVTHEEEISRSASRVIQMKDGRIVSDSGAGREGSHASAGRGESRARAVRSSLAGEVTRHVKQAFTAIMANKVRSALSMLGILIGVASVITMLALGTGAKESITQGLASLGSNLLVVRPGSATVRGVRLEAGAVTRFSMEDAEAIAERVPGLRAVSPMVHGGGQVVYGNKNWSTRLLGTGTAYASMRAAEPVRGRFFTEQENMARQRVAVIGQTLVRELFDEEDPVGETIRINKVSFKVIGVLPEKGATHWGDQDDLIVLPVLTAMKRLMGRDYLHSIDLEVASPERMEEVEEDVRTLLLRRHRIPQDNKDSIQVRNMAQIQDAISSTTKTMGWLLGSIACVSLLVGGIGIMNIMLVSVTERTREIGLRKAIGARRRDIQMQFLVEAVVTSLIGGLLGIGFGVLLSYLVSSLFQWTTRVSLESVALAFGFSATVGIAFGFWPARKAARFDPIRALRYE